MHIFGYFQTKSVILWWGLDYNPTPFYILFLLYLTNLTNPQLPLASPRLSTAPSLPRLCCTSITQSLLSRTGLTVAVLLLCSPVLLSGGLLE